MNVGTNPTVRIKHLLEKGKTTEDELQRLKTEWIKLHENPWYTFYETQHFKCDNSELIKIALPQYIIKYLEEKPKRDKEQQKYNREYQKIKNYLTSPEGKKHVLNNAKNWCKERIKEYIKEIKERDIKEGCPKWALKDRISDRTLDRHAFEWYKQIEEKRFCYQVERYYGSSESGECQCPACRYSRVRPHIDNRSRFKPEDVMTLLDKLDSTPVSLEEIQKLKDIPYYDIAVQKIIEKYQKHVYKPKPKKGKIDPPDIKDSETGNLINETIQRKILLEQGEQEIENTDNLKLSNQEEFKKYGYSDKRIQLSKEARNEMINNGEDIV